MTTALTSPDRLATRGHTFRNSLSKPRIQQGDREEPMRRGLLRRLMDAMIRAAAPRRTPELKGLEWVLIDTRGFTPGEYLIRGWTDSKGTARHVGQPEHRHGGAIGLFTLEDGCMCVGPCPPTVDDGAGLLLMGFTHMMTLPLPPQGAEVLGANWILILSQRHETFSDSELDRVMLLVWAIAI